MKVLPIVEFGLASLASASASARELTIRHFEGEPAAGAVVTVYKGFHRDGRKLEIEKVEFEADAEGMVELELEPDPRRQIRTWIMAIRAEGAATAFSRHFEGEVVLAPEFEVGGVVQDQAGKPVPGAEVRMVHFGLGSFAPIVRHELEAAAFPEFQTRTDADGSYSLPGATLHGYRWPVGGMLNVTAEIDGKLHTGALNQRYFSDSKFFDRDKNPSHRFEHPGPLILYPSGRIKGTVVDFVTGEPVSGVTVIFSSYWFPHERVRTDPEGRFTIEGAHRHSGRGFSVNGVTFGELHLREKKHLQTEADIDDLRIVVRPRVKMRGQLLDGATGLAPPVPLGVGYKSSISPLSADWTERYGGTSGLTQAAADGTFEMELPAGASYVEVGPTVKPGFQHSPYVRINTIEVGLDDKLVQLRVPRKPGILFSTQIDGNPHPDDIVWRQLIPKLQRGELPTKIFSPYSQQLWFYPVDRWGETLALSMEFSNGRKREMLFPRTEFDALEEAPWPVRVKLGAPPAGP